MSKSLVGNVDGKVVVPQQVLRITLVRASHSSTPARVETPLVVTSDSLQLDAPAVRHPYTVRPSTSSHGSGSFQSIPDSAQQFLAISDNSQQFPAVPNQC